MNIKQLILTTGGLLLAGIVEAQPAHPNVILIYTDDHGSLDVNCFGARDLCTPHMDALADQGVRFTQFYGAPVSSVSRASLLTGQFAKRAGLTTNAGRNGLPAERETLAERMKSNGYRTALIGKWHLGERLEEVPMRKASITFGEYEVDVWIIIPISIIGVVRTDMICGRMRGRSILRATSSPQRI